jgi:hypothetical protein
MIEISIAHDKALNSLSEWPQLLYLKLLPHTDDFGRFEADPAIVKARVDPLGTRPVEDFDIALKVMGQVKLISIYQTDRGRLVLQMNQESFERINAFLIKHRTSSEYPPYKEGYELICGDMPSYRHRKTPEEPPKTKADFVVFKDGHLCVPDGIMEQFIADFGRASVVSEIPKMERWLKYNKPKKDYKRFMFNWLNKATGGNDEGSIRGSVSSGAKAGGTTTGDQLRRSSEIVKRVIKATGARGHR